MCFIQGSGSRAHKSASETNLSSLAGGPHPPPAGLSVSASSSASSSTDQLTMLSPTEGVQGRSTVYMHVHVHVYATVPSIICGAL